MSAIFLLVGVSLVVAVGFLFAFIWSVKNGQYDDDYTPSIRILFENDIPSKKLNTGPSQSKNASIKQNKTPDKKQTKLCN